MRVPKLLWNNIPTVPDNKHKVYKYVSYALIDGRHQQMGTNRYCTIDNYYANGRTDNYLKHYLSQKKEHR